jgi:phage gp36-like protein
LAIIAPTAYATLADVYNLGVPQAAVAQITTAQQQAALDAANAEADGYLAGRFRLPLTSWSMDLKLHVCARAAYTMLVVRGYNPDDEADVNVLSRANQALKWLKSIQDGNTTPNVVDSSTISGDTGSPFASQVSVSTSGVPSPNSLSLGVGPPSVTVQPAGFVTVGSPNLRGY